MKISFVLKNKLICTMKKSMVSMATVKVILEHGGVHTKLLMFPLSTELGLILKLRHCPFILLLCKLPNLHIYEFQLKH